MSTHRRLSDLLLLALAAGLSGCAHTGPVHRQPRAQAVGNQGESWEAVLGSPEVPFSPDWEYARLDDAMNIRTPEPAQSHPSFDDLRRLYLNPRPDQIIYFRVR